MINLLNALEIFGFQIGWNISTVVLVLLAVIFSMLFITLIVFFVLMVKPKKAAPVAEPDNEEEKKEEPESEQPLPPVEHNLQGISLDTAEVKNLFNVGDPFNYQGLKVTALYDTEPLTEEVDDFEVEAPSLEEEGEQLVTVKFNGFSASYPISVVIPEPKVKRVITGIKIDAVDCKKEFVVGEKFTKEGLKVMAYFNTDPIMELVSFYVVDEPDLTQPGSKKVGVRYGGYFDYYTINVIKERELTGIELDGDVKKDFLVGEQFTSDGLIVHAKFDAEPFDEIVTRYDVQAPDMFAEGEAVVTVRYLNAEAQYSITLHALKPIIPIIPTRYVLDEESVEAGVLRYNRSFTAKLIQSDDEVKNWYGLIKNELLSYKKVKDRMSWKKETYRHGRDSLAKISFRGKSMCLFLALDPAQFGETKYKVEDVSNNGSYADTPTMYRIKNDRRAKYALELIAVMMDKLGIPRIEREPVDYYMPYEGLVELINKGLIKRSVKSKSDEAFFGARDGSAATVEEEQEEVDNIGDGLVNTVVMDVRYNKSFTAKLIQSTDEIKNWYTHIKNELLAFKKVKARMSWKKENYNCGRKLLGRLVFKGKTLCLYLPLKPEDLEGTKYKVQFVDSPSLADIPCLCRLKNDRRVKHASALIDMVMEKNGIIKTDREAEDYYLPYEGIKQLADRGLVKRNTNGTNNFESFGNKQ